jgi:hypothetical protein
MAQGMDASAGRKPGKRKSGTTSFLLEQGDLVKTTVARYQCITAAAKELGVHRTQLSRAFTQLHGGVRYSDVNQCKRGGHHAAKKNASQTCSQDTVSSASASTALAGTSTALAGDSCTVKQTPQTVVRNIVSNHNGDKNEKYIVFRLLCPESILPCNTQMRMVVVYISPTGLILSQADGCQETRAQVHPRIMQMLVREFSGAILMTRDALLALMLEQWGDETELEIATWSTTRESIILSTLSLLQNFVNLQQRSFLQEQICLDAQKRHEIFGIWNESHAPKNESIAKKQGQQEVEQAHDQINASNNDFATPACAPLRSSSSSDEEYVGDSENFLEDEWLWKTPR